MTSSNSWLKPLQLGWMMALWLTIGVAGGRWLDVHFTWTPWGILAGTLFAFAACGWSVYNLIRQLDKEEVS
jgi:F0F1-type ATP synthase assembly protein I